MLIGYCSLNEGATSYLLRPYLLVTRIHRDSEDLARGHQILAQHEHRVGTLELFNREGRSDAPDFPSLTRLTRAF